MRILLAFILLGVVAGMFSRSMDWRGFIAFVWAAGIVAAYYQLSIGAW